MKIDYHDQASSIDWDTLKTDLIADDFHNGRTTDQLRQSFENSQIRVFAMLDNICIGTARALSDGVGNAYVVDVWTHSAHRAQKIGRTMMQRLLAEGPGQHFYLQTDSDTVDFYHHLGFRQQPSGMSLVQGEYLRAT